MSRLKIAMYRYHELLFGRVIWQAEELRGNENIIRIGDFKLVSQGKPELAGTTLYVRGSDKAEDHDVFYDKYSSEEGAIFAARTFKVLVDLINADDKGVKKDAIETIM